MEIDIELLPIPLMLVKKDYNIYLANKACHDLFGYSTAELIGQELDILLPANVRAFHREKFDSYWQHPETKRLGIARDLYGTKKDGGVVPIEIGLYPFGIYVLVLLIDITTGRRFGIPS